MKTAKTKRAPSAKSKKPAAAPKSNARSLQKEVTRAAILNSALQVFSEHGYEGSSTRDIAAHAGVHHALIKYYFENKDSLWRAAVSFLFERQVAEMNFAPPAASAKTREGRREYARTVLRQYVLYCARHPEHARLMVQESVRDNDRLQWAADSFIVQTSKSAEKFVRLMQKEGVMPQGSAPAMVYMMVGAAQMLYTLAPEVRRVWHIDPFDKNVIESHIEALQAVFIR